MSRPYKHLIAALLFCILSPAAKATEHIIQVMDFQFVGSPFVVTVGDTLTWVWVSGTHTTTTVGAPAGAPLWDSPITMANPTFSYVVTVPGLYAYVCLPHSSMMQATFMANPAAGGCPFTPEITPSQPILCPGGTQTLTASPSGGTYQWYMDGNLIAGATGQQFEVDESHVGMSFDVEITLDNCTDDSEEVLIDAWMFLFPFIIHGGDEGTLGPNGEIMICEGQTHILTLSSTYNTNIVWTNNGQPIPGANSQELFVTQTGNYYVTGAPSVCPNYVQGPGVTVSVVVNQPQVPVIISMNNTLMTASAASYQWYLNGNPIAGATNASYVPTQDGLYTVTTVDFNQCQATSASFEFIGGGTEPCPFTAQVTPQSPLLCPNATDTLFAMPAGGTYQWFKEGIAIPGATNAFYLVNAFDDSNYNFSVAVTVNGCTDTSETVLVDSWVFLPPTVMQSQNGWIGPNGEVNLCAGDTLTLTLMSPYTQNIQWFNAGAPINDANNNVFHVLSTGSYTVTGAPAQCPNFFQTMGVSVDVTIHIPIVPVITQSNDTLYANPQTGPYTWFFNGSPIPGALNYWFVPTDAGLYNVMLEDANQCSGISAPVVFGLLDTCSWIPELNTSNLMLCPGGTDTLFVTPTGGGYQWYLDGMPIAGALNNFYVVHSSAAGSQISVIVAFDGCVDTSVIALVDAYVFLPISVSQSNVGWTGPNGEVNLCSGQSLTLTVNQPYDTNIQWYESGGAISGANATTFNVTQSGFYNVSASPSECPNYQQFVMSHVQVITHTTVVPVITLSNDTLFATGGVSFQWNLNGTPIPGATNSWHVPVANGIYTVTTVDANQCTGTSNEVNFVNIESTVAATVRVYPNPVADVLFVEYPFHQGITFRVVDALGRVVLQGNFEPRIRVDQLADGVYTLTLSNGSGVTHAVFVKQ